MWETFYKTTHDLFCFYVHLLYSGYWLYLALTKFRLKPFQMFSFLHYQQYEIIDWSQMSLNRNCLRLRMVSVWNRPIVNQLSLLFYHRACNKGTDQLKNNLFILKGNKFFFLKIIVNIFSKTFSFMICKLKTWPFFLVSINTF